MFFFCFLKQKTAYELRISDWSSDVCSSDLLGMGLFINWMIPSMPLAVAFALAAVVSPTDPIAVSAIAKRVPIPKRMMHILEGESLLNDASGLVCLRFAIPAALTGDFSSQDPAFTFLWFPLGGILVGTGVTGGLAPQ